LATGKTNDQKDKDMIWHELVRIVNHQQLSFQIDYLQPEAMAGLIHNCLPCRPLPPRHLEKSAPAAPIPAGLLPPRRLRRGGLRLEA
jgi:hypothetical protein